MMKDEGWTYTDLAGELMERGIDINDVDDGELHRFLACNTPEIAAEAIERIRNGRR